MNIKKPNSFARYGNDYVAPLTTIDQIVKPSGERYTDKEFELMSNVENVMFGENCAGKNLLNPTLQTTTSNGVTCTNNGDGTFTLNGTATSDTSIMFGNINLPSGNYKLIGCPSGGSTTSFNIRIGKTQSSTFYGNEIGGGFNLIGDNYYIFEMFVTSGVTCNNLVFKPMITEDLNATYNDFEPYVKSLKQLTNSALNMDLLWTNASPSSAFAKQTISLGIDLSQYKYLLFEWHEFIEYNAKFYSILVGYYSGIITIATTANRWRIYDVTSENNIIFNTSYTNAQINDNYMIPTRIFGVK